MALDLKGLGDDLFNIGMNALEEMKPSAEDREKLLRYTAGLTGVLGKVALASSDKERADLLKEAHDFRDALNLKAGQYAVKAGAAKDRALAEGLQAFATTALKFVVAALL